MAKRKENKTEKKALQPYKPKPAEWLSPFGRMENLFDSFFHGWRPGAPALFEERGLSPSVDIFEEGDEVVVKTELPGMGKDDIDINLSENTITLSGEKKKEEKVEKKNYYRLERSYGSFSRSFHLPSEVQTDKAKASFKNGLLEVRIPKTEEAKKKVQKIKIE